MAASLESLTEVTVRAAEASKGSIGAIETMGDQIKSSIEEMGKSVAENISGALAATMQEVLTQVLRNREPPAITSMGVAPAATIAAGSTGQEGCDAAAASKAEQPRGGAVAGRTAAVARREEEAAKEKLSGGGEEAGATQVLATTGGAPGSSAVPRSRAGEQVNFGARSAPAPAFNGPSLLPMPTDPAHDKVRGKQKMVGVRRRAVADWARRRRTMANCQLGQGEEDDLSFGDP
ncbi:unnamed protein product [Linum trigynum]|uniref:Uncharacterized protein n=1 Tax=Linum trigynum TaxID=586398 RepID=A0AAV2DQ06_9ROSI